jgi:hypothetical protein
MWYRIYFIGKFKIMIIVNEIIFLCYFNIVIQSLDRLWAKVMADCLKPTARALFLTRQHDRKTVHEGEDTNIYST